MSPRVRVCSAGRVQMWKRVASVAFCVHLALFPLPSTNRAMTASAANGHRHVDILMKKGKVVIGGGEREWAQGRSEHRRRPARRRWDIARGWRPLSVLACGNDPQPTISTIKRSFFLFSRHDAVAHGHWSVPPAAVLLPAKGAAVCRETPRKKKRQGKTRNRKGDTRKAGPRELSAFFFPLLF